jgi:beta-lactamase regulating signal transducer with metallopeptidase domain
MILDQLASQLLAPGLDVAVKATVLLVLAGAVTGLCRQSSAALRHSIWLVAMLGLIVLPLATWALPAWRLPILPASLAQPPAQISVEENQEAVESIQSAPRAVIGDSPPSTARSGAGLLGRTDPMLPEASAAPAASQPPFATATKEVRQRPHGAAADRQTAPAASSRWPLLVCALWSVGALIWALVLVRGIWRTVKLRWQSLVLSDPLLTATVRELGQRLALRRKVGLREHPQPVVPLTWGILRPVILLPRLARQWSQTMRHAVLLHELAHIQRGDVVAQLIARMACVLHWYHPLAWHALRKMRQEREQACDDAVVQAGEKASDYAEQLVEVARLCVTPGGLSLAIAMAEGNSLERRLKSLFDLSRSHRPVRRIVVVALLLLGAMLVGMLSSIDPVAATADAVEPEVELTPAATSNEPVVTESKSILTGDAARERLMQVRPQLMTNPHGIQFAVSYTPEKIAFLAGERVPVDLYLRNGGSDDIWLSFLQMDASFPPLLLNEQGDSVPLSVMHQRFAQPPVVVALRPGDVCVIQSSGIGVGAGQHAPALEPLTPGQYHLEYDLPVAALDRTGTKLWEDQLLARPLALEVVDTVPQQPFVRTTGVPHQGYVSPEVLELLAPRFGTAARNVQLGVAVNSLKKSFAVGESIPLTLLYRNVGDHAVTFDTHLDFVSDPPLVTTDRGEQRDVSSIMHWMFVGPTTITLEPGQTWAINTPGLGLGAGSSVTALEDPAPGTYRLTYEEGIHEKLGLPASTPIWSERLTTGPLEFEIAPDADGNLQAVFAAGSVATTQVAPGLPPSDEEIAPMPLLPDLPDIEPETPPVAAAGLETVDLDQHVLWWEEADGLQVGFWMKSTGEPLNLRVADDSLVTYQVVVKNTTPEPVEFLARATPIAGRETPALISSDEINVALESLPLAAKYLARLAARTVEQPDAAYLIRLEPGETVLVPDHKGVDERSLKVGGEALVDQPRVGEYQAGMNWIVQPVTLWRPSLEERARLTRLLGRYQLTRVESDGTVYRETATRLAELPVGTTLYPRIQMEVGTLDAAAFRHADAAVWGEVDRGLQCGIRVLNPQAAYQTGDTIEAELLYRNVSEAVISTTLPRRLDLYPIIEDAAGNQPLIDFGARFDIYPHGHDYQPGEVRSLGVMSVTLAPEGTPSPRSNMEPGQITLPPGKYHLFGSGGVGNICPHSGKVPFVVIAAGEDDVSSNDPTTPMSKGEATDADQVAVPSDTPIVVLADGVSLESVAELSPPAPLIVMDRFLGWRYHDGDDRPWLRIEADGWVQAAPGDTTRELLTTQLPPEVFERVKRELRVLLAQDAPRLVNETVEQDWRGGSDSLIAHLDGKRLAAQWSMLSADDANTPWKELTATLWEVRNAAESGGYEQIRRDRELVNADLRRFGLHDRLEQPPRMVVTVQDCADCHEGSVARSGGSWGSQTRYNYWQFTAANGAEFQALVVQYQPNDQPHVEKLTLKFPAGETPQPVTGWVIEAGTNEPIPAFRMIAGTPQISGWDSGFNNPETVHEFAAADGSFTWQPDWAGRETYLRVEADGHAPEVLPVRNAKVLVRLRRDGGSRPIVINDRSEPVVGASVAALAPDRPGVLTEGQFLPLHPEGPAPGDRWRRPMVARSDAFGRFQVPPDPGILTVIAAHPEFGFGAVTSRAGDAEILLRPWSGLAGLVTRKGQPVDGVTVVVELETLTPLQEGDLYHPSRFEYLNKAFVLRREVTSGSDGRWSVGQLPAGRYKVSASLNGRDPFATESHAIDIGAESSIALEVPSDAVIGF